MYVSLRRLKMHYVNIHIDTYIHNKYGTCVHIYTHMLCVSISTHISTYLNTYLLYTSASNIGGINGTLFCKDVVGRMLPISQGTLWNTSGHLVGELSKLT